ncbi:MAG: hypothetical protein A2504_00195 [Bdellovibrionales bacterium RIFOXYD12_FULL_39_22]|nr:MAG: hypothetical protein A2385_14830 [Bdellovibrionales bacterium RIFOXYB1_FULL_39_21]OFZ43717.1 MAG: hypothetical protein A2485_07650 [Bdellovibrionales bacterium RIFOXYC12_FULL_39_17]OFZ48112.1 MAG: hypothetical protein A2404_15835 [Bdellovibrionales bacterium RIFOXYC1_FULL_39_130]OFZ74589.1 MAG: hypothetical protein A2451_08830 [Bdellovibrionales bacterium RIFOXYC2_FULL_39_8]OFZ77225.1 MAG: hypothetical protein A2560_08150 [Bdellovibrionales bacterium RIFOXYD1_FULL_39_84]OFZ95715.1 MAG:
MNILDDNRFSKVSFFILFLIIIIISYKIVAPFILSIVAGALLAQLLRPLQNSLIKKNVNPTLSAYLILIFFIILMIVPLFFFTQMLITETGRFTQYISSTDISFKSVPKFLKDWPIFHSFISNQSSLDAQITSALKYSAEVASNVVLYLATKLTSFMIDTLFTLVSFVVFLLNGPRIKIFISNLIPLHDYIKKGLLDSSNKISSMAFMASLLAAVAQSIIVFFSFLLLDIPNAFLAFGSTFLFSFTPIIGSAPVWVAGMIYLTLKGTAQQIIFMITIGIILGVVDNLIRAYLLTGPKDNLHPFIGLLSIMGGIQVFGLLGILVGPIVAALLLSMCRVWPSVLEKQNITNLYLQQKNNTARIRKIRPFINLKNSKPIFAKGNQTRNKESTIHQ